MPCFTLRSKPFCYLWKDKKTNWPYLLMVKGDQFDHPRLEQGKRSKMKRLLVDPETDLEVKTILEILEKAASFHK